MAYKLFNEDVTKWQYDGEKFHAMLCDPPYHLTSIVKRFGKNGSAPAKYGTDGAFQRASSGFMGQSWDGGDVATRPETWVHLSQFLHPGAFCMAFSSTRTVHRMMVAIEDAGFIIHPMIAWVQGQGFPKATRVDTQIDKMEGKEREIVGKIAGMGKQNPEWNGTAKGRKENSFKSEYDQTIPVTDLAKQWEGHRYGAQALKPSFEPIVVFQKPYEGKPVENMIETGAGALNIDGGRIGVNPFVDDMLRNTSRGKRQTETWKKGSGFKNETNEITGVRPEGRWPANFMLGHTPECKIIGTRQADSYQINRFTDGAKPWGDGAGHDFTSEEINPGDVPVWECVDGCPVKAMDKQSGLLRDRIIKNRGGDFSFSISNTQGKRYQNQTEGVKSGASRFFQQVDWQLEQADPFFYCPKASKSEKNEGLDELPVQHSPKGNFEGRDMDNPKNHLGGLQGSYQQNNHPTLKPLKLTQYLATLLLPPDAYAPRRILVPFSGTSSEMIGAHLAGWEYIVGIENEKDYIEIANQRLEHWTKPLLQPKLF